MATSRGRRRLGRALVFIGVCLWIPELWYVWNLFRALFTPIRVNGQLAEVHINLNGTAWAAFIGWTAVCWALIGWGVHTFRKAGRDAT